MSLNSKSPVLNWLKSEVMRVLISGDRSANTFK